MGMKGRAIQIAAVLTAIIVWSGFASAQQITQKPGVPAGFENRQPPPAPPAPPPDYKIGVDDVLTVFLWREKEISGDFVVRPDGKVSIPLMNDLAAAGLTVDEFRKVVEEAAKTHFTDPTVTITVKEMRSRKVFIQGSVNKQGAYIISGPMTISQLISQAGGLLEWADKKNILVISASLKDKNGQPLTYKVNYDDLMKGRNVARNNIELRPGDTVIVR